MHPTEINVNAGKGDGYHEFRTVAQQNWDLMKKYYQRVRLEMIHCLHLSQHLFYVNKQNLPLVYFTGCSGIF